MPYQPYCQFERTLREGVFRCRRCGFEVNSPRYGAERIHRLCDAIAVDPPRGDRESGAASSSDSGSSNSGSSNSGSSNSGSRDTGLGDTVARWVRPVARLLGLDGCGGCRRRQRVLNQWFPYRSGNQPIAGGAEPAALLLRFPHGLGDAVQLTTVLLHLRSLRPQWQIDVAVRDDAHSLLAGLCRRVYRLNDPAIAGRSPAHTFDRTLRWWEPERCYADSPSTKAERCLKEVFGLDPVPELCRYQVPREPLAERRAQAYLRPLGKPAVLVHYQGSSSRAKKNLDERAVAALCRTVLELGCAPVILDWDGRSQLDMPGVTRLTRHDPLWSGHGLNSGGLLAALAQQAAGCFGIDSGPGHLFGATTTPSVIVWTRHHPLHYYALASNVLHLVPWQHQRLLRGETAAEGLAYFQQNYQYRIYRHLETALCGVARERLSNYTAAPPQAQPIRAAAGIVSEGDTNTQAAANPPGAAAAASMRRFNAPSINTSSTGTPPVSDSTTGDAGLLFDGDLWIRAAYREADMTIVRDVYLEDCYRIGQLPRRPRYVVDIGAHVGAFAAAIHRRAARARVVCVEPHRANLPALKANVGAFATIVSAAATYEPGPLWLRSSIFPGSHNTGASRVMPVGLTAGTSLPGGGHSGTARGNGNPLASRKRCHLCCLDTREGYQGRWPVEGVTLETLMREHSLPRVDLLKLDCEGCELSILRHAELSAVSWIVGEYHDRQAFMALVRQRFGDWNLRLLKSGPIGLFWLWQPNRARSW